MEILLGDERLPARFWAKVSENPETGCWEWTGAKNRTGGYGVFGPLADSPYGGRCAHRIAFTVLGGSIPQGFDLDHLCRVRHCVNPAHLEAVTRSENVLRGSLPQLRRDTAGTLTHCPQGHEYTDENRAIYAGRGRVHRMCRTCINARNNTPERKAYMREYHRARVEARAREAEAATG